MDVKLSDVKSKNKSNSAKGMNLGFLSQDISFNRGLSDKDKEIFYSDLSILISSGIDIKSALELILLEQAKTKKETIFNSIKNDLISGKSLSEAIFRTNKFSTYEYYSIKIGEETGRISEILIDLSKYYNDKLAQKRQIVNAFSYPVLVLAVAVIVVIFMMNVIVPMFKDVFSRFNSELPVITTMVINISEFFTANLYIIVLLIVIIVSVVYLSRKKLWYRKFTSGILLKIPFIGKLVAKIYLSRFCQAMSLLISSKVPLINALDLVKNMMNFYPYEPALTKISADIMAGKPLYLSMKNHSIFDVRTVSLVKVAEEVNKLDYIFNKLNMQYSDEIKHRIGLLNGVLEPVLIIFIGIMVGIILISMYLPLFQLSTSIY